MTQDTTSMTMDEIIAEYNATAETLGVDTVESFKSLKAARSALAKLTAPPKAAKTPKEPKGDSTRGPRQGIGTFAKGLILEGGTNKEVHAAVLAQFPDAKTSVACIAYYRTKMIAAGQITSSRKPKAEAEVEELQAA